MRLFFIFFLLLYFVTAFAQEGKTTHPGLQTCFDVTSYDLEVKVDTRFRRIAGKNTVHFVVTRETNRIQLDLAPGFKVAKALHRGNGIFFNREDSTIILEFSTPLAMGAREEVTVFYGGTPQMAINPPWKGGFIWTEDGNGKDWVSVVCQKEGASLWWPSKTTVTDKPDSMRISVIVPDDRLAIANGILFESKKEAGNFMKWGWKINHAIDPSKVTLYIGQYKHFKKSYPEGNSRFELDFYVLRDDVDKAKKHFVQVDGILQAYEQYFGPYPFPKDGYAIIEAPFVGNAHQGAIACDNLFTNGLWGFDEKISRETAHEWFGNSIQPASPADAWILESLAGYGDALIVEHQKGKDSSAFFMEVKRALLQNKEAKNRGPWIWHSLRFKFQDDSLFFKTLKKYVVGSHQQEVDTKGLIAFFSKGAGMDLNPFFDQYLFHNELPNLEFSWRKKGKKSYITYKWDAKAEGFSMPIHILIDEKEYLLNPTDEWQEFEGEKFTLEDIAFTGNPFLFDTKFIPE